MDGQLTAADCVVSLFLSMGRLLRAKLSMPSVECQDRENRLRPVVPKADHMHIAVLHGPT